MQHIFLWVVLGTAIFSSWSIVAGCQSGAKNSTALSESAGTSFMTIPASVNSTATITLTTVPPSLNTLIDGVTIITRWQYSVQRFTNNLIFDPKYKGKIFQISGKVVSFGNAQGVNYIVVDDGSLPANFTYASDWRCFFQTDDSLIIGLKEGQTVTVKGIWGWGNRAIGNKESDPVFLDNCVLVI